jgi:glutaredoxin 3
MSDSKVTVYSTTWCGFCKVAKQYFDSKKIAYDEIDVEKDTAAAKQIVEETGQMGVPVIRIGSHLIVGFDRPNIDAALRDAQLV